MNSKIILNNIFSNSSLENMDLNEKEKKRLEMYYNGEITFEQLQSLIMDDINQ